MKKLLILIALMLCVTLLPLAALGEGASAYDADDYFSKRDLSGEWDEKSAVSVTLTDSLAITEAGTYVLSGTLADGTVTVNVSGKDKVQIVLNGVSITSSSSAAICVENADKVFITLAEGTENALTSTGFDGDSEIDAVIYAKDDVVLNGTGSVTITSAKHGIVGKDDVKIASGTYVINAQGRGIDANDSLRIYDGSFTIVSQKDALRAKHDEADKGYIVIFGGTFDLTVGGGAGNAAAHTESWGGGFGRSGGFSASSSSDNSDSAKGLKASGDLVILGGKLNIDSSDDALHTDGDLTVYDGLILVETGDDAFHADSALTIEGGTITVSKSYEGMEAASVTINGGKISLTCSDDGINSSGGNDGSGWGWNDMFSSDGSSIVINGGELYVNASGDGIDANGDLIMTGGAVVVSGPTNSGNGALDYNGTATITGGTLVAAGARGMAENFGSSSTQGTALVNLNGNGGEITVKDSSGNVILTAQVDKAFQCVVVSSPLLQVGQTYTVTSDVSSESFTLTSTVVGSGSFGGGSQPGGQQPGGGQRWGR